MNNDRLKFRILNCTTEKLIYSKDFERMSSFFEYIEQEQLMGTRFLPEEQCTGLKDKNGKLIYEGDIIIDQFKKKWTVFFDKECGNWECVSMNKDCFANLINIIGLDAEVVSNIHKEK